ncbi:MAG: histidinol dehydrogenase [Oscillibacter sp.]|nr:histidinol dehydrogenase [Oscillibacter sp.]
MMRILDFDGLAPEEFLNRDIQAEEDVSAAVDAILAEVRTRGDAALRDYTRQFDGAELKDLWVSAGEFDAAREAVDPGFLETLKEAAENIRRFHERQKHKDFVLAEQPGMIMGQRWTPIERAGICVPRSPEAFPSTVLMNAIPAQIAGVQDIVLVTPPGKDGSVSPEALMAAELAEVSGVFKIGGAQAVAALAYGTETVPRVDKIVGPGGIYVATAKRKVFGQVDIDMIAGPSEILVLADGKSNPKWVAADLLSQAEHDVLASAVLVTDSHALAEAVQAEVEVQLASLPRKDVARKSIDDNGKILVASSLEIALEAVNRIAPEHLELCVDDPFSMLPWIKNAGSIFLGRFTPEAVGDYFAGPNHTLPTSGTARYSSPLGVDDFMKRSSFLCCGQTAVDTWADRVADFARREGLEGHARSALSRKAD